MNLLISQASKWISPPVDNTTWDHLAGYYKTQKIALDCAREVANLVQEGWSELQAAQYFDTALRDNGVKHYFHFPFVWFGDRCQFAGIKTYRQFQPTSRVVREGDTMIFDAAPLFDGYICDIGYTQIMGENQDAQEGLNFLNEIRQKIPQYFESRTGVEIWKKVSEDITDAGFEVVHKKYPFEVLGHRVYRAPEKFRQLKLLHFGWQSYWEILSHGVFSQLLGPHYNGKLEGLWAIEPHIGRNDWGAKFEEILVVQDGKAYWLRDMFEGKV